MKKSEDAPKASATPDRAWTKPVLIEYGHLAKLTRGPSGLMTETGGMMAGCL